MIVVGLDLSLTATGVARIGCEPELFTIPTKASDELGDRLERIKVGCWYTYKCVDLVVVEDLPVHARSAGLTAMVHGVIRWMLWRDQMPTLIVPPATLKVFATGKGNADKAAMIAEACRRLDYQGSSSDEVDALWLAHLGAHWLGQPQIDLPQAHLRAFAKLPKREAAA